MALAAPRRQGSATCLARRSDGLHRLRGACLRVRRAVIANARMLVSKAMRGAGGLQCISLHCLQNYVISNAPCECVENVRSRPLRNVRRGQTPLR
ncbi:hypothetical protein, partial [Xanthomonas vasicola]